MTEKTDKPSIALALSSGGARGYAHIGAIEELLERGYEISGVAGTSMGALIGGIFCAGGMADLKKWLLSLSRTQRLALYDLSPSLTHLMKGEKIINALNRVVPDRRIEQLTIPFRAIATDLKHQREVVFDRGSLYAAIRASIAIPTYYSPLRTRDMLLVDGGITNPLPLNRAPRKKGDLLVAINVSAPFEDDIENKRRRAISVHQSALPRWINRVLPNAQTDHVNYYSLITRTINTQIQRNTVLSLQINKPDILVSIPINRFSGNDYHYAEKIIREGRLHMRAALNEWEAHHQM